MQTLARRAGALDLLGAAQVSQAELRDHLRRGGVMLARRGDGTATATVVIVVADTALLLLLCHSEQQQRVSARGAFIHHRRRAPLARLGSRKQPERLWED